MKRKVSDMIRLLVLLVAFSVLLYPTVSNYLYEKNSSKVVTQYDAEAAEMGRKEQEEMLALARAYNEEMLKNIALLDPFSTAEKEINERYESLMNVNGNGMMGYIRIPTIDVELSIYHGTEETVLQTGVGHFEGTSLPVGGESTHSVLTGHRGLPSKKLFTDLDKLQIGNVFYLKILGETLAYQIDQILTVLPEETKELSIVSGKDYVTLVTCTPYAINTHRLLIRGHRIPYEEAVLMTPDQPVEAGLPFQVRMLILAILLLLLILITAVVTSRAVDSGSRRRRKKRKQNTGKKKRKTVPALLFLLAASLSVGTGVQAAGIRGNLTIVYTGRTDEASGIPLEKVPFCLYRAGTKQSGTWELQDGFAGSGISLEEDSASGRKQQAEQLYAYAEAQGMTGTMVNTDENGEAFFPDLEEGLYLAAQKEAKITEEDGSFRSAPFLVEIPSRVGDTLVYAVIAEPKNEWKPDLPEDTIEPPGETETPTEGTEETPGETEERPTETEEVPGETEERPAETEETPEESEETPENGGGGGQAWEQGRNPENAGTIHQNQSMDETEAETPQETEPGEGDRQAAGARTGDSSRLALSGVGLLLSLAVLFSFWYQKRKEE